ncbi:hypothetical protein L917_16322 [Phytophthora nicotianae]|uniref:Ubiquitin-like protease family profile domain-containing protein n=1 Tax=Phytophthora nicotianae TaxID=4792 RepID=W2KEX1_PHYNI|nr:hypothetical protein L917_16322 [Phytophthora nicotianae]
MVPTGRVSYWMDLHRLCAATIARTNVQTTTYLHNWRTRSLRKVLRRLFSVTVVHSPIQKDGFNCGVFICLYFWRRFWKGAGSDYTEKGLLRRRWDILRTIMEFSDESKDEEKVIE